MALPAPYATSTPTLHFDFEALRKQPDQATLQLPSDGTSRNALHAHLDVDLQRYGGNQSFMAEKIDEFQNSPEFEACQQSVQAVMQHWETLLLGSEEKLVARRAFDLLQFRMGFDVPSIARVERNYFGGTLVLMYQEGLASLKALDVLISHVEAQHGPHKEELLGHCRTAIAKVAQGVQECAPGCLFNMMQAFQTLQHAVFPPPLKGAVLQTMQDTLLQKSQEYSLKYGLTDPILEVGGGEFYQINEVHIAIALYNLMCDQFGLPAIFDPFSTDYELDWKCSGVVPSLIESVKRSLDPTCIGDQLVTRLLSEISLAAGSASTNFPKLKEAIEIALDREPGYARGTDPDQFIEMNAECTEFKFKGRGDLLLINLLERMGKEGILTTPIQPYVLVDNLGETPPRALKSLDDIVYVEHIGKAPIRQLFDVDHLALPAVQNLINSDTALFMPLVWEAFHNSNTGQIKEFFDNNPGFGAINPSRYEWLTQAKIKPTLQHYVMLESLAASQQSQTSNFLAEQQTKFLTATQTLKTLHQLSESEHFQHYTDDERQQLGKLVNYLDAKPSEVLKVVKLKKSAFLSQCVLNTQFMRRWLLELDAALQVDPSSSLYIKGNIHVLVEMHTRFNVKALAWMLVADKMAEGISDQLADKVNAKYVYTLDVLDQAIVQGQVELIHLLHSQFDLATLMTARTQTYTRTCKQREAVLEAFKQIGFDFDAPVLSFT